MADISKITLPNGASYDFKDSVVRAALETKAEKALYGDTTINVGRVSGSTVGDCSTAEGKGTTASGNYSHAEGAGTGASGNYSHAEGCATHAHGDYSHAEGLNSQSNAAFSHAGGFGSYANGVSSFAHGEGVVTNNNCETAFGKSNLSSSNTIFSIGDGTVNARHNAFEITTTGGKLHDKDIAVKDDIPAELPANGGNADYATNAGNAEKLGGKDASAYSTSIIKSVTFSAATVDTGYIWTGIPFPKYVIGVDLEHFDVIVQFYKGNHADAARAEWTMMFFSKDDVTTPLNGSFTGRIYYID